MLLQKKTRELRVRSAGVKGLRYVVGIPRKINLKPQHKKKNRASNFSTSQQVAKTKN